MDTHKIRVYGIVQGVGFRPFVSRTCLEHGIKGTVANKGSYVEIYAQGEVNFLLDALKHNPPARSVILNVIDKCVDAPEFEDFQIIESEKDTGDIFISPDIAICDECKKELFDKSNRRYMHPFINCTNCGPRLTILESMPYDRERTSMKEFEMCPECEYEYTHPDTRRYDAQPVCCPKCGPVVYSFDPKNPEDKLEGKSAITAARKAIIDGQVVAIKGIGGFHLCCDATNEDAVSRLRLLKNRPMKPFAVMMKYIDTVERECRISSDEMYDYLTGYQKPIILLERKMASSLAASVAPDNPSVGVMLPYTPIHLLLFDYDDSYTVPDCLIMTSANVSGAPICRTDEDVINEISDFTDIVLSNNRMIRTRADDSVMDFVDEKPYMIRRSRGFAPLPVMIGSNETYAGNTAEGLKGHVLAIGGELKNTFALAKDGLIYPSAYIGDMADIRSVDALTESVDRMTEMLEIEPSLIVCDMHPKYNTSAVAEELGEKYDIPVMKVQHHYAHILSCMAENDYLNEVIGVSFDGTGYGTDGTIWGGEYLLSRLDGFERLGTIASFTQCGGDLSSKEGWRNAVSILSGEGCDEKQDYLTKDEIISGLGLCNEFEYSMLSDMIRTNVNSIKSTSAGRLFDAVSAILGIRRSSTFEGEAATALMFAAGRFRKDHSNLYLNTLMHEADLSSIFTNTNSLVRHLARKKLAGEDSDKLALIFHVKLAENIAENVARYSEETGVKVAALSGGVFQNTLLLEYVKKLLSRKNIQVLIHGIIPPNDGGVSAGQALAGLYALNKDK